MTNPTFKPNDVVWHVRHGKVTLRTNAYCTEEDYPLAVRHYGSYTHDGKTHIDDVGRVLYTLEEAAQYGWYKPEPLVVEFVEWCQSAGDWIGSIESTHLKEFEGKRVLVTVKEITE